ncbi:alpha/beta hydrolase, partial [Escherichia coli]|uniref:alpha/beta hydrolase n=1 Tax=Escherichia coli TaxID=562 RepID=UPI0013AE742B
RIILAGFSQGCAMTIQAGLRHPEKLAGMICLSGYVPLSAKLPLERSEAALATPIVMAHGRHDNVVPFNRAEMSRDLLVSMGCKVEWHEYTMQHTVCLEEVQHLSAFIKRVLE